MGNKIVTKFKQLTKYFSQDPAYQQDTSKEIIRTKDKAEFERKKLEKQQTKFFRGQWKKVKSHIEQRAMMYETQRYPSYIDYDLMDQYPIISAALDILAEESTTPDANGKVLKIYSESKRVKEHLTNLFYDRLNIHTNLVAWIREMCKYGDNFVYLQIDDERGVVGAKQLPNIEVERWEGRNAHRTQSYLNTQDSEVTFRWLGQDIVEFKYPQIAHFRLAIDSRRLPYGVSTLEKARKLWKNLILVEDAMRTIRLLRAMDRRAYYIYVGNIDPKDVNGYINDIADRFKRKKHVDPETGQEDLKYNVMGNDQDYFIPVRGKDDATRIETIQGSSNINDIADIEYDLNQLFAALGIPKPYLQYEDTAGEGKNLSLQDIRFARKINRIQQAALQELNKIAIVHLMMLGYDDEISNFELTLNNPSTQAELLRTEHLASKISAFRDAVSPVDESISPMSYTKAMKEILGMTAEEIKLNLQQQYMEKVIANEITNAPSSVSSSTIFDNILKLYGDEALGVTPQDGEDAEGADGTEGGGFGGGGGGFTDEDLDFADETGQEEGGEDLDLGEETPEGGETETPTEGGEDLGENYSNHKSDNERIDSALKRISQLIELSN